MVMAYQGMTLHRITLNLKELMHCHCGTNNRAPRWTFTDPCKPEVRPGAREESASPAWLAASTMNAHDTTKVNIWRLDTGCGPILYKKCHSHNTPGLIMALTLCVNNLKKKTYHIEQVSIHGS